MKQFARRTGFVIGFVGLLGLLFLLALHPGGRDSTLRSREGALRTDLQTMRSAIDDYTLDRKEPPPSLQTLVDEGYVRAIPIDPITQKADWTVELDEMELSPQHRVTGIYDIHSSAKQKATDGTNYNSW